MQRENWRKEVSERLLNFHSTEKRTFKTFCGNMEFEIITDGQTCVVARLLNVHNQGAFPELNKIGLGFIGYSRCHGEDVFSLGIGMAQAIRDCRQQFKSRLMGEAHRRVKQLKALCDGGRKNSRLKGYYKENGNTHLSELEESLMDDLGGVMSMFLARAYPGNYMLGWENKLPAAAYMAWHEKRSVPMGNTALSPELARKMILLAKACRFWPRKAVIETAGVKRFLPHMFEPKLEAALKKQLSEIRNQVLEDAKKAVDAQNKSATDKKEKEAKEKVMDSVKH